MRYFVTLLLCFSSRVTYHDFGNSADFARRFLRPSSPDSA